MYPRLASTPRRSSAFTLVELLITIGIIGVLISILLPAVTMVKTKAKIVSTRAMLARIETAIGQYAGDYNGGFPGPFANSDLRPYVTNFTVPNPPAWNSMTLLTYREEAGTIVGIGAVTSSENLYLGLTSGMKFTREVGTQLFSAVYFDERSAKAPEGPNGFNYLKPRRSDPYMKIDRSETTYDNICPVEGGPLPNPPIYAGQWCQSGMGGFVGDSRVPEFVDKFSDPMPILYMRANRGMTGTTTTGTTVAAQFLGASNDKFDVTPGQPGYQYDPEMIQKTYTNYKSWINQVNNETVPVFVRPGKAPRPWPDRVSSPAEDDTTTPVQPYAKNFPGVGSSPNYSLKPGDEAYFGNPTNSSFNHKEAAKKDEYILISAGPDGRYGTADDITNFRE